jgi:PD-(D/E)XK nuclease superfamily
MEEATKPYDLCGQVIGAAMNVHSTFVPGFLESVYQNALIWELRRGGFKAEAEKPISVHYDDRARWCVYGRFVGERLADCRTESDPVVRESARSSTCKLSCRNRNRRGLLVNFGAARLEYKKKVSTPEERAGLFLICSSHFVNFVHSVEK